MDKNRSMPPGTIIPEIPYPDIDEAAEWLCRVLQFRRRLRIGNHRFQLSFGAGSVVATSRGDRAPSRCSIMVRVEDVDAHWEHARSQGARVLNPPMSYPYGERQYTVEDLAGHAWTFSQAIKDVDPADWGGVLFTE